MPSKPSKQTSIKVVICGSTWYISIRFHSWVLSCCKNYSIFKACCRCELHLLSISNSVLETIRREMALNNWLRKKVLRNEIVGKCTNWTSSEKKAICQKMWIYRTVDPFSTFLLPPSYSESNKAIYQVSITGEHSEEIVPSCVFKSSKGWKMFSTFTCQAIAYISSMKPASSGYSKLIKRIKRYPMPMAAKLRNALPIWAQKFKILLTTVGKNLFSGSQITWVKVQFYLDMWHANIVHQNWVLF